MTGPHLHGSRRTRAPRPVVVLALLVTLVAALVACGAEEESTRTAPNGDRINAADVAFAGDMLQRHAESLVVVDATLGRRLSPPLAAMAEQIRTEQGARIERLASWLTAWEEEVPQTVRDHGTEDHHGDGAEDHEVDPVLRELSGARGAAFEELWLTEMIVHHEAAVDRARAHAGEGAFAPARELAESIVREHEQQVAAMRDLLPG